MSMKILFSAVGTTDPISNMHDGSFLHICRKEKPEQVLLYLSAEMLENHKKDNRYVDSIYRLGKLLNHHFDVHLIERPNLVDVQRFDFFVDEFSGIIKELQQNYPDSTLLLNVSSGTPAMKSSLQLIAGLLDKDVIPYQVSTPSRRSNPNRNDYADYDKDLMWECNEDNDESKTFDERISISETSIQYSRIKIDMIHKLLDDYEYAAALRVAETIKRYLPPKCLVYLEVALLRTQLATDVIKLKLKPTEILNLFGPNGLKNHLNEYVLSLQGKLRRDDIDGMLRALSPAITEIYRITLKDKCAIDLKHFTRKNKPFQWDTQILDNSSTGKKIQEILLKESQLRTLTYITNDQLLQLIKSTLDPNSETDKAMFELLNRLRGIEETVRNIAAHQITKITDNWIKENCNLTSAEILSTIKKTLEVMNIVKNQDWAAYEQMNAYIKTQLHIQIKQ